MGKRWKTTEPLTEEQKAQKLAIIQHFKCPSVIAGLLVQRGMTDIEIIETFFEPSLDNTYDPKLFNDMGKAVSRVIKAINDKEQITIYGDYDVDGTTSTALLFLGLKRLGGIVNFYIPHRMVDGYGLSLSGIEQIYNDGTKLIISVDCGINAVEEVEQINRYGMEIIITDHHNPKEDIPAAFAIINPKLPNCQYPFKELAGVGVAYKLLIGVYRELGKDTPEEIHRFLDLVALGTIADIVPLTDENRIFAGLGLNRLIQKKNKGINSLIDIAGLSHKELTTSDIIFGIAPRINAAGRMGSALRAVELLVCCESERCIELAQIIERENSLRQNEDQKTFQEACEIIEKKYKNLDEATCLVVSSDNWHPGVIGIVASKLVEKYYRPTLMISFNEGVGSGSGRSIPDFDLFETLRSLEHLLDSFGGHRYAAGFTILAEYLDKFENQLHLYAQERLTKELLIPPLKIDKDIELYEINDNLILWLNKFAPYGTGNIRPVWRTENVTIDGYPYNVGRNHLKIRVKKDGCTLDMIGFNLGDYLPFLRKNSVIDIAYSFEQIMWQDKVSIQGRLKDIKIKNSPATKQNVYKR
ncbi:MAG: single-stranded-DNA-specific exonuclease RecJ [Candidatus Cloacimonetes bacterium]|nr:single-stranded-DNA-specific exonuclease RecJ [Candidatus Cloacimonadota bacterium]